MVYPTEMTVATGTTVYAADPASDERLVSREVRISVTYRIDEEEVTDVAALARAKAAEVEGARVAASERITNFTCIERMDTSSSAPASDDNRFDPGDPTLEPPDEEENENNDEEDEDQYTSQEEADYEEASYGGIGRGIPGVGCHTGNGMASPPRPAGSWVPPTEVRQAFGSQVPEETDLATKPQVLALGSYFKRLGLSYSSQTALLRTRFGKFRPERLTKAEAIALIRSLERGEVDPREYEVAAFAAS